MGTVYTGVWSGRPSAAGNAWNDIVVTDLPVGGRTRWVSDGTFWVPEVPIVLGSNGNIGVEVSGNLDGVNTEKTLLSLNIPASCMRHNRRVDADLCFESNLSADPNRIFRLYVGNWLCWQMFGAAFANRNAYTMRVGFMMRNAQNAQAATTPKFAMGPGAAAEGFQGDGSVNMASDTALQVRCLVGVAGDWTKLRSAFVVLR
jgi:hypothetical protein